MILLIDQTKFNSTISAIIILLIIRLFGIPIVQVKSNVFFNDKFEKLCTRRTGPV